MNWLLFTLVMLFWSGSFIAIRFSLEGFEPMMAAAMRVFLAAIFLGSYRIFKRVPFPTDRTIILKVAGVGLFSFAIPWALLFWGEQFVSPAVAAILNSSTPIFVLTFSWFFLPQDRPTKVGIFGVFLGFVGILLVFLPEVSMEDIVQGGSTFWGMVAVLGMAISYGLGAVGIRKACNGMDLPWVVTIQCISSSIFLVVVGTLGGFDMGWGSLGEVSTKAWVSIVYLAIGSTALANVIYYHLIAQWGALKASAVTYAIPFLAMVIDWIVLSASPSWQQLLGAVFIVSGLGFIHLLRKKPLRSPHR
ncbi:MAG: DMT family transporter [Bdellovibrionota bacterium]